jgi:hypothetical protein
VSLIAAPVIVQAEGKALPIVVSVAILGALTLWAFNRSRKDIDLPDTI